MRTFEENKVVFYGLEKGSYLDYLFDGLPTAFPAERVNISHKGLPGLIRHFHMSRKVNDIFHLGGQMHWVKKDIANLDVARDEAPIFLLADCLEGFNKDYLAALKEKYPKAKFCLYLLNPANAWLIEAVRRVRDLYDLVLTCSREDAEREGWAYYPDCCYSIDVTVPESPQFDVCFIAKGKGRENRAWEIYQNLVARGRKCDFIIVGSGDTHKEADGFCHFDEPLSYEEYIRHTVNAKCVLELTQDETRYCTLRTMEAYVYGRGLITENSNIVDEVFFDPARTCIFSDPSEICDELFDVYKQIEPMRDEFSVERLYMFLIDSIR